ncbi:hypothetical protein K502DRAFT_301114 [Neoconidiobolus thromboides FSU 785]|nr:hypothetical protein K502DRAFT_301114 [Neoconidiobolus thromboides FSU 785]
MMSRYDNNDNNDNEKSSDPLEWVEIMDPQSHNIIYANPVTGECSWERPKKGFIKERSPEGEWWELFDKKHKLPYYYNTVSKKTVWVRPKSGLIIPLTKIQSVALNNRESTQSVEKTKKNESNQNKLRNESPRTPKESFKDNGPSSPSTRSINNPSPKTKSVPISPKMTDGSSVDASPKSSTSNISGRSSCQFKLKGVQPAKESPNKLKNGSNLTIDLPKNEEIRPESMFSPASQNELSEIKAETPTKNRNSYLETATKSSAIAEIAKKRGIGSPKLDLEAAKQMSPLIVKDDDKGSTHTSTPKSLPPGLKQDINQFQIDGFAKRFFSTHKKGLFRKKVPLEKMLTWTDESISQPLMAINRGLYKDALKSFKLIQRVMGDRSKGKSNSDNGDIQWLIERGLNEGEIRDEIYVQIVKQLTENPSLKSQKIGWELISVLLLCFPPSKNFENYFKSFVSLGRSHESEEIVTIAKYSLIKLDRICKVGPKGKALSLPEIEQARIAAFHLSVFGESLDTIMEHQKEYHPDLTLPRVLPFLTDSVMKLNGHRSEGIFRVPGDMEMVAELKLRIDKDNYEIEGITDCNVPASLLKLFLRDLEEPLIPSKYYDDCLKASKKCEDAIKIIGSLPEANKKVAQFVIKFLQKFTDPEVISMTKMSIQNLAMVFAPSFLRCPSDNLTEVFANSKLEQEFLKELLVNYTIEE